MMRYPVQPIDQIFVTGYGFLFFFFFFSKNIATDKSLLNGHPWCKEDSPS